MNSLALGLTFRDRPDYCDAVGMIRVKEKRDLLSSSQLQEMISLEAAGIERKLRRDTPHEHDVGPDGLDGIIGLLLEEEYRQVAAYDREDLVVPLLRYRHDLHNIKALLKRDREIPGEGPRFSPVSGNHPVKELEEIISGRGTDRLPAPIREALEEIVREDRENGDEDDLLLDLAWLRHGLELSREHRMTLIRHYCEVLSDFFLVKHVWRRLVAERLGTEVGGEPPRAFNLNPDIFRAQDREQAAEFLLRSSYGSHLREGALEWQETGRWALLERDMDNFLLGELSRARSISMGPEPLMAYLLAKEHDFKIIRTIYTFKESGREDRQIRKYLRRLYG